MTIGGLTAAHSLHVRLVRAIRGRGVPLRRDSFLDRVEPLRGLGRSPLLGYAAALIGVAGAIFVRNGLNNSSGLGAFITFYPAVILASVLGRFRAGALAGVLSVVAADYFFLEPRFSFASTVPGLLALTLFALVLALIVGTISLLLEALDRLFAEEDKIRFILEAGPMGIVAVDEKGLITLVNAAAEAQFGYDRKDLIGKNVDMLVPENLRVNHVQYREKYGLAPSVRKMGAGRDLNGIRSDGTKLPVEVGLNPIEREGKKGTLATILDISERKSAERKQQILVHEVQHRSQNMLGLVQVLVSRIFTPDRPLSQAHDRFLRVLQAIGRTQSLLAGADGLRLHEIVEDEVSVFEDQVTISGCEIRLSEKAAQNFSLIVHELATNAVKHGALSRPEGRVHVVWHEEDGALVFRWSEHSGPVVRPPTRRGFGHVILENFARQFGAVTITYSSSFDYQLRTKWAHVAALSAQPHVAVA